MVSDSRNISVYHDTFISAQCEDYNLDPFRWLLRPLHPEDPQQKDLAEYIDLVVKHQSLFTKHRMMSTATKAQKRSTNFLACARNDYEVRGYLGVKPCYYITSDLLYYIVHQACLMFSALNEARFELGSDDLTADSQVWRMDPNHFELKLGKTLPAWLPRLTHIQ